MLVGLSGPLRGVSFHWTVHTMEELLASAPGLPALHLLCTAFCHFSFFFQYG